MSKYLRPDTVTPHTFVSLNPNTIDRNIKNIRGKRSDTRYYPSHDSYGICHYAVARGLWCRLLMQLRGLPSSIVWSLQRPQVMLSWCCGMVQSLVIEKLVLNHLQAHFYGTSPSKQ